MSIRLTRKELERFRAAIRGMSYHSATYKLLRDELSAIGNWKAKPRGRKGGSPENLTAKLGRPDMHIYKDTIQ